MDLIQTNAGAGAPPEPTAPVSTNARTGAGASPVHSEPKHRVARLSPEDLIAVLHSTLAPLSPTDTAHSSLSSRRSSMDSKASFLDGLERVDDIHREHELNRTEIERAAARGRSGLNILMATPRGGVAAVGIEEVALDLLTPRD